MARSWRDFKDYIVVIEGPQNEMRAEQIIAEAKRLVPNKPIRYVINTHTHFDHSGGLRAFVAEGATIVTYQTNKAYYEKIFKDPHTLVPDKLSQMKPQPKVKIETVGEKKVMTDGEHTIELYHLEGSTHSDDMLIVYLPKQKVLIEADEFNVGAGKCAHARADQSVSDQSAGEYRAAEAGCGPHHSDPPAGRQPQGHDGGAVHRGGQEAAR